MEVGKVIKIYKKELEAPFLVKFITKLKFYKFLISFSVNSR